MLARPHGVGPDAEGRLPALQGAAGLRPALPERLRLPGPLDRGRGRALARAQLEARDRGVRARRVRAPLPRGRRLVVAGADRGSIRLGQWMDWGNDYFTFSDTNIEYVWRLLKRVHEQGWLYLGHRSTEWCPRCGTSISQHELSQAGVYQDRADPSLFVRLPAARPPSASRSSSGRRRRGRCPRTSPPPSSPTRSTVGGRTASGSRSAATPRSASSSASSGAELVGWRYRGPFDELRAGRRRRAPRDPLGGRHPRPGHGDRPHRAGLRRRGLRALEGARAGGADAGRRGGPLLRRLRLVARPLDHRVEPTRSSATSASAACSSRPGSTSTPTRTAGAATRR